LNLEYRSYVPGDYAALGEVMAGAYADLGGDCADEAEMALLHELYPAGQLVCTADGVLVGAVINRPVPYGPYTQPHTQLDSVDKRRYRPDAAQADAVYALDIFVHPGFRAHGIARHLADRAREQSYDDNATHYFGVARLPGFHRRPAGMDAVTYVDQVCQRALVDPVLTFQLSIQLRPIRILPEYNPADLPAGGYGVLVGKANPRFRPGVPLRSGPTLPGGGT